MWQLNSSSRFARTATRNKFLLLHYSFWRVCYQVLTSIVSLITDGRIQFLAVRQAAYCSYLMNTLPCPSFSLYTELEAHFSFPTPFTLLLPPARLYNSRWGSKLVSLHEQTNKTYFKPTAIDSGRHWTLAILFTCLASSLRASGETTIPSLKGKLYKVLTKS